MMMKEIGAENVIGIDDQTDKIVSILLVVTGVERETNVVAGKLQIEGFMYRIYRTTFGGKT